MGNGLDSRLINTANQQKQSLPFGLLVFWFFFEKIKQQQQPRTKSPIQKIF
jgi:hypothetical protein